MSICFPPVWAGHDAAELKKYLSRPDLGIAVFPLFARHLKDDRMVTGREHSAFNGAGPPPTIRYRL
jgi:hypothetical protein